MYVWMYAVLCVAIFIPTSSISYAPITMLPKHSLSGLSGRHVRNSVTTIWSYSLKFIVFKTLPKSEIYHINFKTSDELFHFRTLMSYTTYFLT